MNRHNNPDPPAGTPHTPAGPPHRTSLFQTSGNYIAALLMDIVFGCVGLGLSLRATHHFKLEYVPLAMLFAVGGFGACAGCLWLAKLSDRLGRRPVILVVLGGVTVTSFSFSIAAAAWQLYVLSAIHACLMGTFWSSLEARITDGVDGPKLARRLGLFGIFFCTGLMLGDPIGGALADWTALAPFYAGSGVTFALLVILAVLFRRDTAPDHHPGRDGSEDGEGEDLPGKGVRKAFVVAAWTANGIAYAVTAVLTRLFPRFATLGPGEGGLDFSGGRTGVIGGAAPFGMLCIFVALARLRFWHYRFRYLVVGQCVSIGGLLMYAFGERFEVFLLGSFLFGLGKGVTYIASIYYSLHGHTARAGRSGLHEGTLCFGYAMGMILTGLAASVLDSHRVPYWVCIAIVAAGIAAEWAMVSRARSREAAWTQAD